VKPYSIDLRERIVAAFLEDGSQSAVAAQFGVCTKTVQRYVKRHHQGKLAPRKPPGAKPRVSAEQEPALIALMHERSDWTLDSMAVEWERRSGVRLPRSTFHDHLVTIIWCVWVDDIKKESRCQRAMCAQTKRLHHSNSARAGGEVGVSG
jgi:transposase